MPTQAGTGQCCAHAEIRTSATVRAPGGESDGSSALLI